MSIGFSAAAAAAVVFLWIRFRKVSRLWPLVALVAFAALVLSIAGTSGKNEPLYALTKNEAGQGDRSVDLQATAGDQTFDVSLSVPERPYTEEEIQAWFDRAEKELPVLILGENASLMHVDRNLELLSSYPGIPVHVSWYVSPFSVLDDSGRIGSPDRDGTRVKLSAELYLQEHSRSVFINVRVFPNAAPVSSASELTEAADRENAENKGPDYILPSTVNGREVIWQEKKSKDAAVISLLTLSAGVLLVFNENSRRQKAAKAREEELTSAYPNLVSTLLLLLYAGITMRQAFIRMAADYLKRKADDSSGRTEPVMEEVVRACRDMERGISEQDAYDRFASRLGLPCYRTLAVLLIRSVKKGSADTVKALERECVSAFEARKRLAREQGDKASLKLLLPMGMLLMVVLAIMMIPAFLTM